MAGATAAAVIGSVLTTDQFNTVGASCGSLGVDGVLYYQCGDTWYQQANQNGQTTYVVVNPPE